MFPRMIIEPEGWGEDHDKIFEDELPYSCGGEERTEQEKEAYKRFEMEFLELTEEEYNDMMAEKDAGKDER